MLTVIFETHATSLDNEAGRASGHYDVALSATGEAQARERGERYAEARLDAVYCSDLQRSYRTAEIALAGREVPVVIDARLREVDYGELTRRPKGEVDAVRLRHIEDPFPGGESYVQAVERLRGLLDDASRAHPAGTVLLIGHYATHIGLEYLAKGVPIAETIAAPYTWRPGWRYQYGA
ncbi:MAG: histidine phosphatase family protein [Dehalococcoidia bacterium]|nr:histidine phosphatase family protein [Dehalococcoidia bacterium]